MGTFLYCFKLQLFYGKLHINCGENNGRSCFGGNRFYPEERWCKYMKHVVMSDEQFNMRVKLGEA